MDRIRCPICQGKEFTEGTLKGKFDVKIIEDKAGFIEKQTIFGGDPVRVKICSNCKYLLLFG